MSVGDRVKTDLAEFQTLPLKDAARRFFKTLGYESDRFIVGAGSTPQDFLGHFAAGRPFDQAKALVPEWTSADLLFQLTDQELSREYSLFTDDSVQRGLLKSYVFVAIGLKGRDYARGKFSAVARQINRLFPMPVMVLFRHGDRLTIAVINRRRNKLDDSRDVLEKATLIRDISFAQPHRGHLDILASLALPNLVHPQKKPITDFDTLHAAWEQIFNVELLNERFYRELANWYFWALPQVEFPDDLEPNEEKRRATGLIRLLTRLIFCWFIKEKDLIPEKLFHPADLAGILKGFDPESETSSTYYLAILQNLFFATLNQRMGKDSTGKPYRFFARDEGFQKNRATYDVNTLYRYESLFAVSEEEALALFEDIPFLNGGLFECLDRTEDGTNRKLYLDGFSRNDKKRPHVPDRLFFDSGETADLSEVYGDKKRKSENVTGLITLLNRYKFTIVENTPIDQEIALDPELLGEVFENLLASYNEETKTTARKQTGSFYTPRPIVDYMVDESLKAHLKQKVAPKVEQTFLSASSSSSSSSSPSSSSSSSSSPSFSSPSSPSPSAPPSEDTLTITRRDLPHWKKDGSIYWITFRMADSLPQEKLKAWKAERDLWTSHHPEPWDEQTWDEYNERFGDQLDQWLDAGMGSRALARPDIREAVKSCLLKFDGERLIVHSAVIMPNHVHALIEPLPGHDLSKLLQGIKGASAREANKLLGASGTFWLDESYDHIVRSEAQYHHFLRYIQENPLKPGLTPNEYWLKQGGADIPVCGSSGSSVCDSSASVSSKNGQTGMSAPHSAPHSLSQRLDQLFSYTDEPHLFSDDEVGCLIAAIDSLKVLDPACGSGAFPMGVLHKLVYILGKLDPDNERWKQTQLAKLDSPSMRDELERAFAGNNDDYGRKLYLIENCLYGVDIQPVAIQITKLRFFISLVCDQRTNLNKKENRGIRPLPNLETKFVAANTLIGLPEIKRMEQFELVNPMVHEIEQEIESLYHRHFTIQRRDQKLALQREIKALRRKLADTLADSLGTVNAAKARHLAAWDPFDPQASADFFDPHWMFGRSLKDGFDVVIGNPPYISVEKFARTKQQEVWRSTFKTFAARGDVYCFFYERGLSLLRSGGILGFITSNKFQKAGYGRALRQLLAAQQIETLVDFCELPVFEAATDPIIVIASKVSPADSHTFSVLVVKDEKEFGSLPESVAARGARYKPPQLKADGWSLEGADGLALVDKLRSKGTPLITFVSQRLYRGILTGLNEAFVIDRAARDRLVRADKRSAELIKPWIRGKDIKRWTHGNPGLFFIQIPSSENTRHPWTGMSLMEALRAFEQRYPAVAEHLLGFGEALRARTDQGTYYWELRSCAYWSAFDEPKIVFNETSKNLHAYLDTEGNAINKTGFIILTPEAPFVLSVLNSTALDWLYRSTFPAWGDVWNTGRVQFRGNLMNQVPIPAANAADKAKLTKLADRAAKAATAGDMAAVSVIEREIDEIVYRLFDLTPAEITQIETALVNTRGPGVADGSDDDE